MTVLSVVKDACLDLGLDQPAALFSSTDREHQELVRVAKTAARTILKAYDWQALNKIATFTGDGTTDAYDLPSDYDRMVEGNALWSSKWVWSLGHVPDVNTWLEMVVTNFIPVNGNWIIYGNQFHFLPQMASGELVKMFYVSKQYAIDDNDVVKTTFSADTDTFRLDEELLRLCIIWKWRESKSLPYEEKMADYQIELNKLMLSDGGARGVVSGNTLTSSRDVKLAWPGHVSGVSG